MSELVVILSLPIAVALMAITFVLAVGGVHHTAPADVISASGPVGVDE